MPKSVKICLTAVIVVFVISVIATLVILSPKDEKSAVYVEILRDNEVVCTLDPAVETDRTFRIECENGWNEITVKDGKICVSDADCPDRTCVKSGYLRHEHLPVVCLPHRLVIRFAEDDES